MMQMRGQQYVSSLHYIMKNNFGHTMAPLFILLDILPWLGRENTQLLLKCPLENPVVKNLVVQYLVGEGKDLSQPKNVKRLLKLCVQ